MKLRNTAGETVKAGCVVVNAEGKVLLVTNPNRDHWEFPKGHAEPGETAEQVAVRETFEETGYQVRVTQPLPDLVYSHGVTNEPIRVSMFLAEPLEQVGEPEETFAWHTPVEAKKALYPNLVTYLHLLD